MALTHLNLAFTAKGELSNKFCVRPGPELVATVPSLAEVDATGCPQEWVEQLRQLRPDVAIRQ